MWHLSTVIPCLIITRAHEIFGSQIQIRNTNVLLDEGIEGWT